MCVGVRQASSQFLHLCIAIVKDHCGTNWILVIGGLTTLNFGQLDTQNWRLDNSDSHSIGFDIHDRTPHSNTSSCVTA